MDYKDYEIQISYKRKLDFADRKNLSSTKAVYDVSLDLFADTLEHHESFFALYVDSALNLIAANKIADGGLNYSLVDLRFLFQGAILSNAYGMILVHNHPSGVVVPSKHDRNLLSDIEDIAKRLNIMVMDFFVISKDQYYSMAEEGQLK